MMNNENNYGFGGNKPEENQNPNANDTNNGSGAVNDNPKQDTAYEAGYARRPEPNYGRSRQYDNYNNGPYSSPNYSSPNYTSPNQDQRADNDNSSWVFSEKQQNNSSYNGGYENGYGKQNESYRWSYDDYQQSSKDKKNKKNNNGLKIFAGILGGIVMVGVLTLAGFGVASLVQSNNEIVHFEESVASAPTVETPVLPEHNLTITDKPEAEQEILTNGKLTIPQRAEKVKASVVGIVNYQRINGIYTNAGEGSGIIMSENGYIITNAHVVEGAAGLKVVLSDNQEYSAQIIGSDSKTDIAVIKIEAAGLPAAEFGNSDQLEVGEQLIAVGNPTGLELGGTLTVGYVSALNRQIDNSNDINYIQTDAAINPGNSGGALANEYGQVIGINSAKIAGTNIEGLGFAIAINDAQPIIDDLMNYGYVRGRVRIGISVYEMDAFMAQLNKAPQGLIVGGIEADAPAANSGLMVNDIITAIDGEAITEFDSISEMLKGKQPGDTIVLSVFRRTSGQADRELTIEVALIESVEKAALVQDYSASKSSSQNGNTYQNPYTYFGIQ